MYCVSEYEVLGFLGGVGCQNELSDVLFFAEAVFDLLLLAYPDFLCSVSDPFFDSSQTVSPYLGGIWAWVYANQILVLPLKDDQADDGVLIALLREELYENERVNGSAPG